MLKIIGKCTFNSTLIKEINYEQYRKNIYQVFTLYLFFVDKNVNFGEFQINII
jgi:hypothetical protein